MTGKSENGGWAHRELTVNEEAEHCPICLGAVGRGNLAMPDSCCHIFCLNCILTWAESQTVPSCPVDRRSFSVIYKWDTTLGCVLVPVNRKMSTLDPEGPSSCFSLIPYEGQMTQRTHAKTKGHVKKCKNEDLSVINKTKIRQTLHSTWSLSPFGMAVDSLIPGISEPLWVAEEESPITGRKQCRDQTQSCPWLLAAIPASGLGNSRHSFDATVWRNSRFDFRICSSFSFSGIHSGFSNFVFQGRGCAVTCPKGGEKNGGQTSGSKAPAKQTESVTSRRSNRNSKAQEEAPTPVATSSQSHSSDSDLSGNRSPQLCEPSPAIRNGKQAASRKSDGKKIGPDRRNATSRVFNSLTASEEDEEAEEEKQRKGKEEGNLESESSDAEATQLQWNQSSSLVNDRPSPNPSLSNAGQELDEVSQPDKDRSFSEEQEQVVKEAEGGGIPSPPSKASVTSPGMSCDGSLGEYPIDSGSSEEMEDLQQSNLSSHSSKHVQDKQEDSTYVMKISKDLKNKASEVVPSTTREQESSGESQCCDYPVDSKILKAQCPSEDKLFECETENAENVSIYSSQNWASKFSETSIKEDNQSKDDIDTVLMDCGLPNSEHNNNLTLNPHKESSPASLPATTSPGIPNNSNGSQRERESSSGKESLDKRNGRERRSRFHSATTTWSPRRESSSWECLRDQGASPPVSHPSCVRSRERSKDSKRDSPKKERSRERRSRKRSRSRSLSRSRSHSSTRSRSRTRLYRQGASPEQPTLETQSPSWRTGHVSGTGDKNHNENGSFADILSDPSCSNNPDWVLEKTRSYADARSHESGSEGEDKRSGGLSDSLTRRGTHMGYSGSERGQAPGRGGYRNFSQMGEQEENRWQPRNTLSGTANNSGTDAYSRYSENRGSRRKETDHCELLLDRSGWSSASSWAVRRTLPADVQSYYSRRERGASGGGVGSWSRQEDDQPMAPDLTKDELTVQAHSETPISLGVMRPMQYSLGQYVPPVSLQPRAPYGMLPQVPIHLHPTVPLLQVPAVTAQAPPPPPPPPPPMLHGILTADQPDSRTTQKLQIQERAINEVKIAIKPYYQKKDITKEEYKQIVRKAVEKVCHSKSGEVNSGKVANLVKAYVDKYKHTRKK